MSGKSIQFVLAGKRLIEGKSKREVNGFGLLSEANMIGRS